MASSTAPSAPQMSERDVEMAAPLAPGCNAPAPAVPSLMVPPDLRGNPTTRGGPAEDPRDLDPRDLGASAAFFCPITQELYRDPVLVPTGQTYERKTISRWLMGGNLKCPVTGQTMDPPVALVPNVALRHSVEEWCEKNMPHLLDDNGHLKPADASDDSISGYETEVLFTDRSSVINTGANLPRQPRLSQQDSNSQEAAMWPRQKRALWTFYVIIAVLVVMFVVELAASGWQFAPTQVNPLIGPDSQTLILLGAKVTPKIVHSNEWWRLLTAAFLSAGLIQLLASILALWTFGRHVERETSAVAAGGIFLVSAVGGALLSANMAPDAVTVGSNGGVFGMIGAAWAEHLLAWRHYKHHWVAFLNLAIVTAINALIGMLPFVDNWTNSGGLFIGAALCCAILLTRHHSLSRCREASIMAAQAGCALAVLGFFVGFVLCLILDLRIAASCSWCHYLTCVPTALWVCDHVVTDPDACQVTEYQYNATVSLGCPDGRTLWVPAPAVTDEGNFVRLCQQQCGLVEIPGLGLIS